MGHQDLCTSLLGTLKTDLVWFGKKDTQSTQLTEYASE